MVQQIIFILVAGGAIGFAIWQYSRIRRNILLGQDEEIGGHNGERWKKVLLIAFGQKKMFKQWIPAIFHFFIYAAFLITQIELIEIFLDGFTGIHRFFAPKLGVIYPVIIGFIEVLSIGAFVGTVIFLWRRNALTIPRFNKPEMKGWPKRDANIILIGEIILLVGIFSMNGADVLLQDMQPAKYPETGTLAVSSFLGPLLFGGLSESSLVIVERTGWWLHIIAVLGFLNYLPISKHLHILLAFPNTYYTKLQPKGQMENMPAIMEEVKSMMGLSDIEPDMSEELPEFGAKDIFSLSWKNLLDAYSCTECGRCTAVCPANMTGKKLSPRKIVMDIRDRTEEVGNKIDSGNPEYVKAEERDDKTKPNRDNFDDGKSLFDYISSEELAACTTCNACVEACPVLINPLDPILKLRRYKILTESAGPADWLPMFNSIESSGSAWQIPDARDKWAQEMRTNQ